MTARKIVEQHLEKMGADFIPIMKLLFVLMVTFMATTTSVLSQYGENWLDLDVKTFNQWNITTATSPMDDSRMASVSQNYGDALEVRCLEGEIGVLYAIQDAIIIPEVGVSIWTEQIFTYIDVIYRIDKQPAVTTRWNPIATMNGIAIEGQTAKEFIRDIYNAKKLYIRIGVMQHQYTFDTGQSGEFVRDKRVIV